MSISQKLIPIKCNKELLSDRFRHLVSFIDNFQICRFQLEDWDSSWGVTKANEHSFTKLIKEYMTAVGYYYNEETFKVDGLFNSDLSSTDIIIVLHNDLYFGILTVCDDYENLVDIYEDILSNLDPKITPIKTAKSNIPDIITPLQFVPYEI